MAYATKEARNAAERRRYRRKKRDPRWWAAYQRANAAKHETYLEQHDPNERREREQEQRFRWRGHAQHNHDVLSAFRIVPVVSIAAPRWRVLTRTHIHMEDGWVVREQLKSESFQSAESLERKLAPLLKMRKPSLKRMLRAAGHV